MQTEKSDKILAEALGQSHKFLRFESTSNTISQIILFEHSSKKCFFSATTKRALGPEHLQVCNLVRTAFSKGRNKDAQVECMYDTTIASDDKFYPRTKLVEKNKWRKIMPWIFIKFL